MYPAVGLGVLREALFAVTQDGFLWQVQVVLLRDYNEPQGQNHCGRLEGMCFKMVGQIFDIPQC